MEGSSCIHVKDTHHLCEEEACGIFKQILCAVKYCHYRGIIHRDLKADNILLDAQGNVKVIDFGFGTRYSFGEGLIEICGAFTYCAPKVFLHIPYYGHKVDIWSLGILSTSMVMGTHPLTGKTFMQLQQAVLYSRYNIPLYLSMGLRNIIIQMLTHNPAERPTLEHIVGHPWLSQGDEASPNPSAKILPNHLDPAILAAMCDLGYNPHDIYKSLLGRNFDERMATYLMMLDSRHAAALPTLSLLCIQGLRLAHPPQALPPLLPP
jgi:serine/threonine protein kinase